MNKEPLFDFRLLNTLLLNELLAGIPELLLEQKPFSNTKSSQNMCNESVNAYCFAIVS